MSPPPRLARIFTVAVAMIACCCVLWPDAVGRPSMWGDPLGEADNHLWMFWRALVSARGGDGVLIANSPAGVHLPLMDPVNLPFFLIGGVFGPAWGWKLMAVGDVLLAMLGGWMLSRQVASRRGALVGMVAAGSAPFLAGVIDFGITESWTIGWFGIHAALLVRYARGGRRLDALGAGFTLGLIALSGWYAAFFGLVLELPLVLLLFWRHRRWGLWLQGLVGLAMVLPSFVRFLGMQQTWSHRWFGPAPGPPGPRADWAELPVFGTDLLNLIVPHPDAVHPAKASYLGLVLVALVIVGLVRSWRRSAWLVALAVPFLLLALGYWPTVAGRALGVAGPAWWLVHLARPFAGLSHWERALGAAVPLLAAAAAVGADHLARRTWGALLLAGAVLLDAIWLAPVAWPRTGYQLDLPGIFAALPGDGGVVQIPFDNGRRQFSDEPARLYDRWQVLHGRAVSESYESGDALLAMSMVIAAVDQRCHLRSTLPPYYQPPPNMRGVEAPSGEALRQDLEHLRGWGYRWLVLHRERCPRPAPTIKLLNSLLGAPVADVDGDRAWALDPASAGGGER